MKLHYLQQFINFNKINYFYQDCNHSYPNHDYHRICFTFLIISLFLKLLLFINFVFYVLLEITAIIRTKKTKK